MKYGAREVVINPKYGGYQRGSARMVYKTFGKKTGSGESIDNFLAQELRQSVIEKFKRRSICATYGQ